MSKHTGVIPPADGWKARSWYLVEVKGTANNPIHKALFYSGFLTDKGTPGGNNQVIHPTYDDEYMISDFYYFKVLKELEILNDE